MNMPRFNGEASINHLNKRAGSASGKVAPTAKGTYTIVMLPVSSEEVALQYSSPKPFLPEEYAWSSGKYAGPLPTRHELQGQPQNNRLCI